MPFALRERDRHCLHPPATLVSDAVAAGLHDPFDVPFGLLGVAAILEELKNATRARVS
jgi:hypothetical protein